MKKIVNLCLVSLFLTACSSNNTETPTVDDRNDDPNKGRYQYSQDHAPADIPNLDDVEDAVPRYEPYSRGGNKDYRLRGVDYKVWRDITELTEKGGASWYGNKFHGHLTANGERYDMFEMTAAHKNLPLPSYVQVTNLENNKKVIVRVNDRGPFHEGRIIDLSYAAANKLGILAAGTGQVEIELIHFPKEAEANASASEKETTTSTTSEHFNIQYLVTSSADKAVRLSKEIKAKYKVSTFFDQKDNLYFLRLGPVGSESKAKQLLESLKADYPNAFIIDLGH
ncbi:septal ring lytic transglycosylase RlpA family protein [Psychromonas aquatilis]|uniref:Endolytic peptidoglycan transglycosylase RlpA n=1 Tax=Psychromonas aquatilis TaxID=2005072 RepID=A0ABU9GQ10_9GAMM